METKIHRKKQQSQTQCRNFLQPFLKLHLFSNNTKLNLTAKTVIKYWNEPYVKSNTKFLIPMRMITVVHNLSKRL